MTTSLHYNGKAFLYAAVSEPPRNGTPSRSPHAGGSSVRQLVAETSQVLQDQADRLIG